MPFAVNVGGTARPVSLVRVEMKFAENVPLEPLAGTENVTGTEGDGWPKASVTLAARFSGNAVNKKAPCAMPPTGVMIAAGSTRKLYAAMLPVIAAAAESPLT